MTPWKSAFRKAIVSGGLASALSTLALAWRGQRDVGAVAAPLNAPSHWLWPSALNQDDASVRYTFSGMVIHHLSAVFWAVLYERAGASKHARTARSAMRDAGLVTAVAACVDLKMVPERLTPGFQHRLNRGSLCAVYGAFAVGMAMAAVLAASHRYRT
ncbi:MAG: hypothetical protein C0453_02480 [Comamonadaceae bacterium]|nr:hypothetical protein [Comamonadaceae bacterium]